MRSTIRSAISPTGKRRTYNPQLCRAARETLIVSMRHIVKAQIVNGDRYVELDGLALLPEPSQKLVNHSPNGFGWGYGGSGPAQLALAILLQAFRNEGMELDTAAREALLWYQTFKVKHLIGQPIDDGFELDFEMDEVTVPEP